jgi:ABC-type polysaccharide/polyol phosphate transport system ATPase subunit
VRGTGETPRAAAGPERGGVFVHGVSRSFLLAKERNLTLKETILRRGRTKGEKLWAVRDLNLEIAPGEAVGIIGQNGSGKSTLLKMLAGILRPQEGTIQVGGSIAAMLELGAGFHPDFTGRENVYMNGAIHGLSEKEIDKRLPEIVAFAELPRFIDMPIKTYSSGMQLRLAFAITAHVNPDVLLLDEVLAVGDEAFQRKCLGRIFEYRRRGGTLIFVSHDAGAVERVCNRVVFLEDGQMLADGPPDEVLAMYHRRLAGGGHEAPQPETVESGPGAAVETAGDVHDEPESPPPTGEETGDIRSWGTLEVEITAVHLIGPNGPTDRFMSGEPFSVEMVLRVEGRVETPNFGLSIHTADGALCYGTNTRLDSFAVEAIDGETVVRFRVPALTLHEGAFVVTAAAVSRDEGTVYHWLDRLVDFTVFPRHSGVGPTDISGVWEMAENTSAQPEHASRPSTDQAAVT